MGDDIVRRRVLVSGRVQGVAFRANCEREAQLLGVQGWVRNVPDRAVEVVAEGTRDDVDALVAWCRRGPRSAIVTGVVVHDERPRGESGFRIVY